MIEHDNRKIGEWTAAWLDTEGIPHTYLVRCDSTSRLAKDSAQTDPPVIVYITEDQEAGRGRGSKTWTSPAKGTALLATWSLEVDITPQHLTAPQIGLALFESVKAIWPSFNWSIKPPNDLYLGSNKVAGLLIETFPITNKHRLLVGLGFNVFASPAAIPEATFLEGPYGSDGVKISQTDWHEFLERWQLELQNVLTQLGDGELDAGRSQRLLAALKSHPILGEKTVAVESSGNIVYQDQTVNWQDL